MLVDEPEEDETEVNAEEDQDQLSPETEHLMKDIDDTLEVGKSAGKVVVDDDEKSLSSSEDDVDAEVDKWIKENYDPRDRVQQKKRKRSTDDDDEMHVPPEDVQVVQTPSLGGRKKSTSRKQEITLEKLDDFSFVNDLVKKLQKKVDEVSSEKKKLEKRVKSVEVENSSLLKKVEADQADIDILKVRIAELEEEKARRDEQNEYFKLKNKELEAKNAKKEHEDYMIKKVIEDLIGKPIEQRFEEIELEEVRARRKAEIEAEMKDKGIGVPVEGVAQVTERAIVLTKPTKVLDPCPITTVSGEIDDDEEDEDDNLKDDADEVYSVHSDDDDDGNDDDDQGTSDIKVTEASNEENIDDYLQDDANEESESCYDMFSESCMTTETVIVYKVGNESKYIHLYDPMWIVNCYAKDIECLFVNKIGYKAEDKDQALQFQKVAIICFQKGIYSKNIWLSKWRKIEKEEFLKAEKERKECEEKDRVARFTVVQRLAEEEQRAAKENEKLRKALLKKPKRHEEKFKSLCRKF
ncbi:uncharacterized protein DDB_G0283697-like [Helianthus annuus]|uniref:uncharacterized protein DDB_G0283697-like n=1 Tax=Helianthus annuus TaxID=4232 RepID=UPI000B8F285E|nr:uncharacterized protein DDB_G0283697-like [Helianthus annuus]